LPAASSRIRRLRSAGSPGAARARSALIVEGARDSVPDGEEQDGRIRFHSPRHELEHLRGRPVQPLGVLDDEEQGRVRRQFRDQPKRREADQEQVGSVALGDPERRLERAPLRVGKDVETVEQRQ
jgi:hypothetical protein